MDRQNDSNDIEQLKYQVDELEYRIFFLERKNEHRNKVFKRLRKILAPLSFFLVGFIISNLSFLENISVQYRYYLALCISCCIALFVNYFPQIIGLKSDSLLKNPNTPID